MKKNKPEKRQEKEIVNKSSDEQRTNQLDEKTENIIKKKFFAKHETIKLDYYKGEKKFNFVKTCTALVVIIAIFSLIFVIIKVTKNLNDLDSFHSLSLKAYKYVSDKDEVLNNAFDAIDNIEKENKTLTPTNLNLAFIYDKVVDDEDLKLAAINRNLPIPVTMDEDVAPINEDKSTAFQIFEKLQDRYKILNKAFYNLCDMNPVNIVRQYHYNGYSIIGKYNPEDKSHIKGKRHTYFIPNFSNVNMYYFDGDGNPISDDNNIKDIISLASVYAYYHDPYDYNAMLKHSYNLFDKSYSYVASISEVYYCSGCMHYDDPDIATDSVVINDVSLDKITRDHSEQNVPKKDIPYKAGTLTKMRSEELNVNSSSYDDYVSNIYNGKTVSDNNYCPGHIDLNVYVKVMTLDASIGLTSIDSDFGNRGMNYNKNWHGWDSLMLSKARELYYKDWEKEYGISLSYIDFVKPLTQEEINFYLNRLDKNITPNRRKLIETALKSVGRIPYYYGGKTSRAGYDANYFGSKVLSDYKGRCLKGLDCSGWVSWVYLTAFNKYIIKSEGTSKLATEGTRITRKELLPGDLIIRPGIDSHVMMFLEWAPGGKMKVIHENGSVNNVSIGTFDAYYPYYRRIINT